MRFEDQVIAVYGQRGHKVRQEISRNDITTDLVMESAKKETWIVRCVNHVWTDLDTVKDVYQVMLAEQAQQCAVVTRGAIANEAYEFAQGKPIFLVNDGKFYEYYRKLANQPPNQGPDVNHLEESTSNAETTGKNPLGSTGCWWGFAALGLLLLIVVLVRQPFSGTAPSNNPPASSSTWAPVAAHLFTGVKVYYGTGENKAYGFEVLGGSESCSFISSGRGIKVKYPNGSIEWKDRDVLIFAGLYFVKSDDPALARWEWIVFNDC